MAGETTITVIGNLTADPELRYTSSGIPVCSFRVASTPRVRNRQTGEWSDGDPLFLGCELWREAAENAGESLKKGMRVIVQGNLTQRSYQTQSGEQRTVFELKNCEVGPSLFRAKTAQAIGVKHDRIADTLWIRTNTGISLIFLIQM